MEEEQFVWNKVVSYFEERKNIPFARITCEMYKIDREIFHEQFLENVAKETIWRNHILTMESYDKQLISQFQESQNFLGVHGRLYCLKYLYYKENLIGKVIFGGFCTKENALYTTSQKLEKKFSSASILETKRLDSLIKKTNSEVDSHLMEIDKCFFDILDTLTTQMHRIVTVLELCEKHYCSISQIRRVFIKHTGQSFKKYYFHLKLEEAYARKQATSWSNKKIAASIGYAENPVFLRKFKEYIQQKS